MLFTVTNCNTVVRLQLILITCLRFVRVLQLPDMLFSAGLYQAAQAKEDRELTVIFENSDAVASEVHYHATCHRQYINSVTNKLR